MVRKQTVVDEPDTSGEGTVAEAAAAPSSFNLGAFTLGDVATMEIKHPVTDEGIGSFIDVYGADTPQYLRAQQALLDRKLKKAKGNLSKMEFEADEMPMAVRTFAVAVSHRFHGAPLTDPAFGTIPEFPTEELRKKLFAKYPWLAEQLVAYTRERGNFFRDAG